MVYLVIVEDAAAYYFAVLDKELCISLKIVTLDKCHGRPYAGDDKENDKDGTDTTCFLLHRFVDEINFAKPQIFYADIGRQHNEYAVDEEHRDYNYDDEVDYEHDEYLKEQH
jgi:hypothetical protein